MTGGEPTLRDDYLTIAGYFHQKRIPVSTITSGWTINETLAKEMCRLFSYIQVSIDGSEAEVHDYCRGRRGSFDRAINAIKLFKKHRANRLCVAYSCNKYNIEDFPRMVDLCLELGVDELKTQYLVMVGRAGENEGIEASEEDYQKVRQFIEKKQKELERDGLRLQVAWGNPVIHILLGIATSYVMVARITAEGYYSVSPYLPYVMGNVREKRLIDVWNNGLRRAWAIPTINRKIRGVSSVEDIHRIYKEYGAEYIDVLQKERHLQGDLTCQ
jgi:MoaA/NifB/PqqE/SkfB family radical SAM enzyme